MTDVAPVAARPAKRVLLIGLDGADWAVLRPLLNAGRLPNLERLIEHGLSGTMVATQPTHGAPLWVSIATGHRPDRHGIYAPAVLTPRGVIPAGHEHRAAHPIWTILTNSGLRTHGVAWPATHPAEAVDGVFVSDRFAGGTNEAAVFPADLTDDVASLRVLPAHIADATLAEIVGPDAVRRGRDDPYLRATAAFIAEALTTHNALTALIANDDWDFVAAHYALIGRASNLFLPMRPPRLAGIADADACFGGAVDAACVFQDLLLGRVVQLAGDDAAMMIVSGHGFASGDDRPAHAIADPVEAEAAWHRGGGICVLAGPAFKHDALIEGVTVFDLAPTVLALLGQPTAADAAGKPLFRAMNRPPALRSIASWEERIPLPAAAAVASDAAWNAAAPLIALGHTDRLAETSPAAVAVYLMTLLHRAEALIEAGRHADARPLLDHLIRCRPDRPRYHLQRFNAALALNDLADAQAVLRRAAAAGHGGPLVDLGRAMIDLADDRPAAALDRLNGIDAAACSADVFVLQGDAYARLARWPEAETAFTAAIARESANARAWLGRARVRRRTGRLDDALVDVRTAITHRPDAAAGHLELAVQCQRRSDSAGCRAALRRVLAIEPSHTVAARMLSRLTMVTGVRKTRILP